MGRCDHERAPGVLAILTAQCRRDAVGCLPNDEAREVSIDALVDYVVEEETHPPAPAREYAAANLRHRQLPELADEGLLDHDSEHGPVTTAGETDLPEPYLEVARCWESWLGG